MSVSYLCFNRYRTGYQTAKPSNETETIISLLEVTPSNQSKVVRLEIETQK